MRIFNVVVEGHFKESLNGEIKSVHLTFLIDATSVEEAFEAGPLHAECVAMVGPKWVSFKSISASPIEFPYMLSDTTGAALRR